MTGLIFSAYVVLMWCVAIAITSTHSRRTLKVCFKMLMFPFTFPFLAVWAILKVCFEIKK